MSRLFGGSVPNLMTVRELMLQLRDMPQDADVYLHSTLCEDGGALRTVNTHIGEYPYYCRGEFPPIIVNEIPGEWEKPLNYQYVVLSKQMTRCGPVVLDNDGCDFLCMGCGVSTRRTRDNPYPTIKHKVKAKK